VDDFVSGIRWRVVVISFWWEVALSLATEWANDTKLKQDFFPPKKPTNHQLCVISGFRRDVDDICVLLGYYAA